MITKKQFILSRLLPLFICIVLMCSYFNMHTYTCFAKCSAQMPFYNLSPKQICLRSKFYTSFSTSSLERIHNIKLASKSLDKVVIESNAEFSFNKTVGARTVERGYKNSKIIVGGAFIDGVGGGVCQVSTTLYNALLLAGLPILEYHPHSLPVSYVAPSFDAMVSFGYADLKFLNNTKNPIIIHTYIQNSTVFIEIYGQASDEKYVRESVVIEDIKPPKEKEIIDIKGEYPDLYQGQTKVLSYSKAGLKSQGYIITTKNGKPIKKTLIRTDTYNAMQGVIVHGTTPLPQQDEKEYFESEIEVLP